MDRPEVITLIAENYEFDEIGQQIAKETSRDVFCDVHSISRDEWYEAGRDGMQPEYRMTVFRYDYADEQIAEFKGKRYRIYRTYIGRNETLELYLRSEVGV